MGAVVADGQGAQAQGLALLEVGAAQGVRQGALREGGPQHPLAQQAPGQNAGEQQQGDAPLRGGEVPQLGRVEAVDEDHLVALELTGG